MTLMHLGKYNILEEIGRGGFATVYRAEDTTLGREVALKVLDPLLMRDETFIGRFQREARAAARLEHPHIVPIYEVGEGDGRLYIAMRLVRAGSLAMLLQERGRLSWDETLDILRQVGDALAYAHTEGVVHRDIKPDNVLLDERSGALLSDFGFAQLIGSSSMTLSLSGGIVGTPAYIPPEIWEAQPATLASDIYALGCVLYEMLTGQTLFDGATPMAVMRAHDQGAQWPTEWPLDMPPDIIPILRQALAHHAADRYQDIPALLEALNAVQTAVVRERIATEVARLRGELTLALEQGQFEAAIALGEQALKLQPDDDEGRTLLERAQERLAKQQALAVCLVQEQSAAEAEQMRLHTEQVQWEAERATLEEKEQQRQAEEQRLQAEIVEREQRLRALAEERDTEQQQRCALEEHIQGSVERHKVVEERVSTIAQLTERLRQGELEKVEKQLAGPEDPAPVSATASTKRTATPRTERQAAHDAGTQSRAPALPVKRIPLSPANIAEMQRLFTIKTSAARLFFSPDNRCLASVAFLHRRVLLWELSESKFRWTVKIPDFCDLAFSPDGKKLAIAYLGGASLWNMADKSKIRELNSPATPWCLSFVRGGTLVALGCSDGHIRLWDTASGSLRNFVHMNSFLSVNPVSCIASTPDGKSLVAAADGAGLKAWSLSDTQVLATLKPDSNVKALAFSKDGRLLVLGTEGGGISLWKNFNLYKELPSSDAVWNRVALSSDATLLTSVSYANVLHIRQIADGKLLRTLPARDATLSPDGTLLALVTSEGGVELWGIPE